MLSAIDQMPKPFDTGIDPVSSYSDSITADELAVGTRVIDRDDVEPDTAIVVHRPGVPATDWDVDGYHTVATFPGNGDYPGDDPVLIVVFEDVLTDTRPGYAGNREIPLTELNRDGTPFYAFPASRLKPLNPDPDPDPELVAIGERLADGGMTVEIDGSENVVRAEKLGETYTVSPNGSVTGDGVLRDRVETVVGDVTAGGRA